MFLRRFIKLKLFFGSVVFVLCSLVSVHAQQIQVTGFNDFDFGLHAGGDVTLEDTLCVYKDSGNKNYRVTGSGDGTGGAYQLSNGSTTATFEVRWRKAGANNWKIQAANVSKNHGGANTKKADCNGTDNAEMQIKLLGSELDSMQAGVLSGNVTITVEPL